MKLMKMAFAAAFALASANAYAFHDGGVASCESCHTMHNAKTAATGTAPARMGPNSYAVYTAPPFLLQGSDPSSTCLICHGVTTPGSYHVLDANTLAVPGQINANTVNMGPGGDFAWLQMGARKGHNIVAADFPAINAAPAETRKTPPGLKNSTWDGTGFSCVSCHDPHGQSRYNSSGVEVRGGAGGAIVGSGSYPTGAIPSVAGEAVGVYRILGSSGWAPKSAPSPTLSVTAPVAIAPSTYNKSETAFALGAAGATGQTVVAYVSGMSEWCGSCHGEMHGQASTGLDATQTRHPSGASATLGSLAANYNTYIATGNVGGTKAYDALVPFESAGLRSDALTKAVDTTGTVDITAATTSNVMCLTCHRAHASGFDSMLRWDTGSAGWNVGTSGDAAGANGATAYNKVMAYYSRGSAKAGNVYGDEQRNMCNKCHAKD